jgi:uncharacterized protein DUF5666
MTHYESSAARICAFVVAALLCLPVASMAVTGSAVSANVLTGTVQSMNRDLNYFTIRDQSGREMKIDVRNMDTAQSVKVWNLRPGDRVTVNGTWENGGTLRAFTVGYTNAAVIGGTSDPNTLFGTVDSVNRDLNFITVRDRATGRRVKVDVRRMDTRQSVNVWQLRAGDPIVATGGWTNRNRFQADRVSTQPMTSASAYANSANFVSGTVQSTNRDLNYLTVRDDLTGRLVKVDVRQMDTRHSVNVWKLRAGDRVSVNGSWENGETFQASTVSF